MPSERWHGLPTPSIPDYLHSLQIDHSKPVARVWRTGGRNRTHAVAFSDGGGPDLFVKQFGPTDHDAALFSSEQHWTKANCVPSPELVHSDEDWRILVLHNGGKTLQGALRGGSSEISADDVYEILRSLQVIHVHTADTQSTLPPVLTWLKNPTQVVPSPDLTTAQRRLLVSLGEDSGVRKATAVAIRHWESVSEKHLTHGDLKLDHVVIAADNSESRIVFLDWEFARNGPPGWDYAGLLQSLLAEVVLSQIEWSKHVSALSWALHDAAPVSPTLLARLVALRLIQTAVEWETGRPEVSRYSAPLCQLAVNLCSEPKHLKSVLSDDQA